MKRRSALAHGLLATSVAAGLLATPGSAGGAPRASAQPAGPRVLRDVVPHVFRGDLRDLPRAKPPAADRVFPRGDLRGGEIRERPASPAEGRRETVAPGRAAPPQFENPALNFDGQDGGFPPDPIGDVGPSHYVQAVNVTFRVYDKQTGSPVTNVANINSLWSGVQGQSDCRTNNDGDPVVVYDQFASRFLIAQFTRNPKNDICVAVSQTSNPVTGGWFLYEFPMGVFPDYFKLGVWPDGYYVGFNQGDTGIAVLERSAMLTGQPADRISMPPVPGPLGANMMLPSDADGATPPPAGAPNVYYRFVDADAHGGMADRLELFEFSADFQNPASSTFTGPTAVGLDPFDSEICGAKEFVPCIPQPGTANLLDPIIEWPMWRLQYRNFGTHQTLVGNFTMDIGDADHAGIRWFELRKVGGGAWTVHQQGTHAPDAAHRWMGSIAMDDRGNLALGYSVSDASTIFPSLRYVGRLASDPLGTLPQGEVSLHAGSSAETSCQQIGPSVCIGRWGDYSSMNLDPIDDCTFWFTGQYSDATANRETRIGSFRFCDDHTLTVQKVGTGSGTVTSNPAGIDCGGACTFDFEKHEPADPSQVTLSASPDPDSVFVGWSGAGCSGIGDCTVTMTHDQTVTASFLFCDIIGGPGDDVLEGTAADEVICGGEGDDVLIGRGGADLLFGGPGTDTGSYAERTANLSLSLDGVANDGEAGEGDDLEVENVIGGSANDTLVGAPGEANGLDGGPGRDVADYATAGGAVTADLGAGVTAEDGGGSSDALSAIEDLSGTPFADSLTGDGGANALIGGGGADRLIGLAGADALLGETGADRLQGGGGRDVLDGGPGKDLLAAGPGRDTLIGRAGRDTMRGHGGKDLMRGGGGRDRLRGGGGADVLRGQAKNDNLKGQGGRDRLFGNNGNDALDGGPGIDRCKQGPGSGTVKRCEK